MASEKKEQPELQNDYFGLVSQFSTKKCPNHAFGEFCSIMKHKSKLRLVFYSFIVFLCWNVSYIIIFVSYCNSGKSSCLRLRREVNFLWFLIIILFGIDFILIFLPLETNTKTSLETNFQTRPRHVLKQNMKRDQYQDWSWFENSVKTETNTWS